MKLFSRKRIPIFLALLTLLTLLYIIPACVLAGEQNMQNMSGNRSQDFENRPEMVSNGTQPSGMMNNSSQMLDLKEAINGSEMTGPRYTGMEEKDNSSDLTVVSGNKRTADSDISEDLLPGFVNTLKSLYVTD